MIIRAYNRKRDSQTEAAILSVAIRHDVKTHE